MAIYIAQHGKYLSKDQDPEKGLSPLGRQEVERIAQVAAHYKAKISSIVHSGKHRAVQTAEIFAEALTLSDNIHKIDGINPLDDVAAFADGLDISSNVLIVGHLPFLEKLVAYLITGQIEKPVFRIQNGGIICLDTYPDSSDVIIKWALMPNVG